MCAWTGAVRHIPSAIPGLLSGVDSKSRLWNDPSDPHVRVLWYAGMQKSVNEMSHFKAVPRCLGPWL